MYIYILLIGHFISDFFFQSSKMAELKKKKFKFLFVHCVIYAITFLIINIICLTPIIALKITAIISTIHFVVDFARCKIDNKIKLPMVQFISFIVDQIIHIGLILIVYGYFSLESNINGFYNKLSAFSLFESIILYSFLFCLLLNPASVFIKKLLSTLFVSGMPKSQKGKKQGKDDNNLNISSNQNIGSTIGMLERAITAVLLLCNQYAAIGLVLTAKSIARFKQLEEQDFAEKYLIGTLTSLTISLIVTLIIKNLL